MSAGGPPEWWFYHLKRTSLEAAIGPLLEKCLERGWRVLAVSPRAARRGAVDEALWTYSDGSFLPHGQADAVGLDPKDQPILISAEPENANEAHVALLMDGAELDPQAAYARCMVIFDDGDAQVRNKAREQYAAAKAANLTARYFQQAGNGWKEAG